MSRGGDMSQKDPAIKLFGWKIPLPECQIPATSHLGSQIPVMSGTTDACGDKTKGASPCAETSEQQEDSSNLGDGESELQHSMPENKSKVKSKPVEGDKTETSNIDQDKTFKKPDKIVPCPRCNSLETKFCYFNNYNVNQPRHFCKNCQRYWTAGGTMRNVPVGAGRRKNKHLPSQYRHIMVASDEIPATRLDTTDSSGQQLISSFESSTAFRSSMDNGTVLKFGPDAPLCNSMESMLNLRDQKRSVDANSLLSGENGEEPSLCGSSVTSSSTQGNELSELNKQMERGVSNELKTSHGLHCYPVPPWVLPWNPAWNNVASMAAGHQSLERVCNSNNTNSTPMHCYPTPVMTVPGICPPNIPMQFLPATYWGGMPVWAAGAGTTPVGTNGCLSPSSSTSNSCCSGNGSPTLGKHSRDTAFTDEVKSEKCVLVPKTLRIDDPNEALKSPIWATLGIKPNKQESVKEGAGVETKELKGEGKDRALGVSQILEANPAAICRAHAFEEST